jgi:HTH-type transcriptional regulator/antitoxin HigA
MIMTVTILPVRTAAEHAAATAHLRALMDAADADARADEIAVQAQIIEAFERVHFPIPIPDVITAIEFRMEQEGLERPDLAKVLDIQRGRVSELLNGKRQFTVAMLRALHRHWDIPAEALLAGTVMRRKLAKTRKGDHRG